METFRDVIKLWPSYAELATDLGEKVNTVRKWHSRYGVPPYRWPALLRAADARGFSIDYDQLEALHHAGFERRAEQ